MMDWTNFEPGDHRISCPSCGRGDRDKTCGVTIDPDGTGVAHCFRCAYVENYRPERGTQYRPGKPASRPLASAKRETLAEHGLNLWAEGVAIRGTVGAQYLQARGCALPPQDGHLRYHPALRHPCGYCGPALLALITDAQTGEARSIHRTWVLANGEKADVTPPRLVLKGHSSMGVVRLWPCEYVSYGLGVAEGIETALTLARVLAPSWAAVNAGNLAKLPVLAGIEVLTIAADHDDAGLLAARTCAKRWTAAGVDVRLVIPPTPKTDLNDFARKAAA
jgi:putative DNA primase/helicase